MFKHMKDYKWGRRMMLFKLNESSANSIIVTLICKWDKTPLPMQNILSLVFFGNVNLLMWRNWSRIAPLYFHSIFCSLWGISMKVAPNSHITYLPTYLDSWVARGIHHKLFVGNGETCHHISSLTAPTNKIRVWVKM